MGRWLTRLLDAAFPEACRLCAPRDRAAPWVCDRCIDTSPDAPGTVCASCGLAATPASPPHRGPLVRAATAYEPDQRIAAAVAVRMLKYDGRRRLARPLARLLHRRTGPLTAALLVPVPLHPRRLHRRGFNQASLLARHVAHLTGLAHAPTALVRTRETSAQTGLVRVARLANLAGAFSASPRLVAGRPIVLVDDVLTTGATLAACARALHAGGAREVSAIVVARRDLLSAAAGAG
jgi:ComF family protein